MAKKKGKMTKLTKNSTYDVKPKPKGSKLAFEITERQKSSRTRQAHLTHTVVYGTKDGWDCYLFEDLKDATKCVRNILKIAQVTARGPARIDRMIELHDQQRPNSYLLYFCEETCPKGEYTK